MKREDNVILPVDRTTINPEDERDLFYWSRHFRVPASLLRAVIARVGTVVENVRAEVARMRQRGEL
ncbi:MAG: DUF3606 domain-containing protein [Alphaproteobacteria bacterium]|nr:DUF3606 domain-containing protein [Alphaproteobacteria bacterium]